MPKELTIEELQMELKAHVMAMRNAIDNCPAIADDRYVTVSFVRDSDDTVTHAWFYNHPETRSGIPHFKWFLGYVLDENGNPDPNSWDNF